MNIFSRETRETTRREVTNNHKRMLELDEKRKAILDEYHKLDDEVRRLHKAIEDACDVMGIDFEWQTDELGVDRKVFFLIGEEPSD